MFKIKQELIADKALPKRAQWANIDVLLTAVLLAFSALLIALLMQGATSVLVAVTRVGHF